MVIPGLQVSDGGVHSHIEHLKALLVVAKEAGIGHTYVHFFADGRDTAPTSGGKDPPCCLVGGEGLVCFVRAEGCGLAGEEALSLLLGGTLELAPFHQVEA